MNNIFENAYFGKAYKTRDGKKAIYSRYKSHRNCHEILIEAGLYDYNNDGSLCGFTDISNCDIVFEWREEINEEELDELAKSYAKKELGYTDSDISNFDSWNTVAQAKFREVCEDFKAGYRKARKEITIKV